MITERTIINALIIAASFVLVPYIVSSTMTVDYLPILCLLGFVAAVVSFFFLKNTLCIWPLLGGSISGTLNFLPLPLKATHVFCILLIIYYVGGYVIVRQKRVKFGKKEFLWPILFTTLIVFYHNHNLHVRLLGGGETEEGGKPAILIYLVLIAYFCAINVNAPSVNFLRKVPLYTVYLTLFSAIPYALTTFIPSLAPALYLISDNVNVEAYLDTQTSSTADSNVNRMGALGPLGGSIQLYLLCYYPIGTWLRPERWWVAALSLLCTFGVLLSGFRNVLVGFAVLTLLGAWCYYSWRALFLPAALVIAMGAFFIAADNKVIALPLNKLPFIAQRTLSVFPGDWDQEVLLSAKSSNEFRQTIQDVYIKEYLMKSPLIGNGFTIDTQKVFTYADDLNQGNGNTQYLQAKMMIEAKAFHTGWVGLYDAVGFVGFLAFLALGWQEIRIAAHFIFGPKANRRSSLFPLYVWLFSSVASTMFGYFTTFGDFGATFPILIIFAMVLSQLMDIENAAEAPVILAERAASAELVGARTAPYGYQSGR